MQLEMVWALDTDTIATVIEKVGELDMDEVRRQIAEQEKADEGRA